MPTATFLAGFRTLASESDAVNLEWEGAPPRWLSGDLLRTGPALFEVGGKRYRHWFDGLAMLHRFALTASGATYTNRFLRGESFNAATTDNRVAHGGFATNSEDPYFTRIKAFLSGKMTDNGNVNVAAYGDNEFVALTEVPRPTRFDRTTLSTQNDFSWTDDLKSHVCTAHPHYDAARRLIYNCETVFAMPSFYRLTRMAYGCNSREVVAEIRAVQPAYVHSFAMSERYLVIIEFPLVTQPLRLLLSGRPFIDSYRWRPERGARLTIVDKDSGSVVRTAVTEPCFGFHVVNAFEREDAVTIDFIGYEDAEIVGTLQLDKIRAGGARVSGVLTRFIVPLGAGEVIRETLSDVPLELPYFDAKRHAGRVHRHVWAVGQEGLEFMDRLQKHDLATRTTLYWSEPGCFPGEPVFVASPDGDGEDEGVILSVVLDAERQRSFLLLLDAATMVELARAWTPHIIPFGFHGNHYREPQRVA